MPIRLEAHSNKNKDIKSSNQLVWLVEDKLENKNLLDNNYEISSPSTHIERLVISKLKMYDINVQRASSSRINHSLQNLKNACTANRANTTHRQIYSLFSSPQSFYLTHKLYRFNAKRPLSSSVLNEDGQIKSLSHIFDIYPSNTIGIAQGISFGPFLDQEIAKLNKKNIYYRGGTGRVVALESMLYLDRFDFLLALPIDITPTKEQEKQLEYFPISNAPPYLIAYFNCSKSTFGKKVIKNINQILEQLYQTPEYYKAHKKSFSAQELSHLQQYLKSKFTDKVYISEK